VNWPVQLRSSSSSCRVNGGNDAVNGLADGKLPAPTPPTPAAAAAARGMKRLASPGSLDWLRHTVRRLFIIT